MTQDESAVTDAQRHARPMTAAERQRKRRAKIKAYLKSLTPEERFRRDLLDFVQCYPRTICPEIIKSSLHALTGAKTLEIHYLATGDAREAEGVIDDYISGTGPMFRLAKNCRLNGPERDCVTCARCHVEGAASADEGGPRCWKYWRIDRRNAEEAEGDGE